MLDSGNASMAFPPLPANGCTRAVFKQWLDQPQFQIGPIGVRVQQGPKLPPL